MSGNSLWPVPDQKETSQEYVFTERERHANVRKGDLSYPMRSIRDKQFLYIYNPMPERMPAGDSTVHQSVGQFGDVDNSITKYLMMNMVKTDSPVDYFELSFGKRPEEELYDVQKDPYQLLNLAGNPAFKSIKSKMRGILMEWMKATGDRRADNPTSEYWDNLRYTPDYQHTNVDYKSAIREYLIRPPHTNESLPCEFTNK
ncbi:MAG: hypothetical protein P8X57_15535 [Cyclobacteriaceae bacterium]